MLCYVCYNKRVGEDGLPCPRCAAAEPGCCDGSAGAACELVGPFAIPLGFGPIVIRGPFAPLGSEDEE